VRASGPIPRRLLNAHCAYAAARIAQERRLQLEMIPRQTVARESGEVTVAGYPCAAFCNCKRRVLCVCDEFSGCRNQPAQFQEALEVIETRHHDAALRLRADLLDCRDRNLRRGRRCVYPWVRNDPDESQCNQHAERERLRSVHHVFEPSAMSRMGFFVRTMSVYQDVYVRHQHITSSA
jgi:hypothetical protein